MDFIAGEVIYFNKPLTWTSFDLVNKFRYKLSRKLKVKKIKVGHAGTLDPLATGVMIICTGKATKRIDEFQYQTKEYIATLKLGETTPSFDLEKEVDEKYTLSDNLWAGHQRRKEKNKREGKGFGYSLFDKNSAYTNTISARYYKDGSEILIEQPGRNPRRLTPREAARLQGFPEEFIIPVSDTQAYKEFGNSVAEPGSILGVYKYFFRFYCV